MSNDDKVRQLIGGGDARQRREEEADARDKEELFMEEEDDDWYPPIRDTVPGKLTRLVKENPLVPLGTLQRDAGREKQSDRGEEGESVI
jgi:hypothetical protein